MSTRKSELTQLLTQKELNASGFLRAASTYETFQSNPVTAAVAGGAASGTAGVANVMAFEQTVFEYAALGTQTITAPSITAAGLNIGMDQTDNDGMQMGHGITSRSKHAYTIGTTPDFFIRAKFTIAVVAGTDDCAIGFRKTGAYAGNIDDYTDMATLNVIAGDIKIETILNNAATVTTDTTQNWADTETHTLEVKVSQTGVVTYLIDGLPPTVTAAYTFDSGDVVVPFFFFLNANAAQAGIVPFSEWQVGLERNR